MKQNQTNQHEFIHPYRQNKRWFSKYLNNHANKMKQSQTSSDKPDIMLDWVSKASSIKIKQSIHQSQINKTKKNAQSQQQAGYLIYNKRKNIDLKNPQLFELISKHIQSDKKISFIQNKTHNKSTNSKSLKKVAKLQPAIFHLQKTPKITQFSRQTFYRNNSLSKNKYSSKKQFQDNLHCKSDLDINITKISLFKKTKTNSDKKLFYTYQIYSLNNRIGINVQILAGSLNQIKFRLILNEYDTKTYNNFWKSQPEEFIQKCLIVNDLGISLRIKNFNEINPRNVKTSRTKQFQKIYLQQRRESIVKKQMNRRLSAKKIGNKYYSQDYMEQQKKPNDKKQTQPQMKATQQNNQSQNNYRQQNASPQKQQVKIQNINTFQKQSEQYIESFNSQQFTQQQQQNKQNQTKLVEQTKLQEKIGQQSMG